MPNRIIKESALTSHSLAQLSDGAERLFWRLTVVADDQGRFDAFPPTVKAKCFPTLVDTLPTSKIDTWLAELGGDHCKFYTVAGRQYGYFVKWAEHQRIYGLKSKFPPPAGNCGEVPQPAGNSCSYSYPISDIRDPISEIKKIKNKISEGVPESEMNGHSSKHPRIKKPKVPLPETFMFNDRHKSIADGLGLNVASEYAKFKDKALACDYRYADWDAAFRNWISNSAEFKSERRRAR